MSVKLEAAYHEAGHAVAAILSKYHSLVGTIDLSAYGEGGISVALSKECLSRAGKQVEVASAKDPDVARDLAVVLCAGLASERLAAMRNPALSPSDMCAEPDYESLRSVLSDSGLSRRFDRYEGRARELLERNWHLVEAVASYLHGRRTVLASDVIELVSREILQGSPH